MNEVVECIDIGVVLKHPAVPINLLNQFSSFGAGGGLFLCSWTVRNQQKSLRPRFSDSFENARSYLRAFEENQSNGSS